jgi:hypothetical protein
VRSGCLVASEGPHCATPMVTLSDAIMSCIGTLRNRPRRLKTKATTTSSPSRVVSSLGHILRWCCYRTEYSRYRVRSAAVTHACTSACDPADLIRWTGGKLEYTHLHSLAAGQAPLEAFMSAKQEMGDWSGGPRAQPWDIKTLHAMRYSGRP